MATEIITPMQMYWLTRLSPLGRVLGFIVFCFFILAIAHFVAGCVLQAREFSENDHKKGKKILKITPLFVVMAIVTLIMNCLLPTTREMAAILIVPRIANSEKIQTVGNNLYDLAVEWMEELHPAKKNNGDKK